MQFIETRGNDGDRPSAVNFSDAILNPSASFGGLYVPQKLPDMGIDFLADYINSDYKTLAYELLKKFEIDIEDDLLLEALGQYDKFDDANNPVPLKSIEDDCFVSELYHGPTRAFKDMALQPFGVIFSALAKQRDEEYLIMAATSGDTGPATLETFKNRPNIKVACLYPEGGTSDVQRLQMVTEDSDNLKVIGVKGNFDDTQNALKSLLSSEEFKAELKSKGINLSAANSVNFGRIIFQIIYHLYAYLELVRRDDIALGEKVYLVVPSGNFGNALGAYYAKKAGLPVKKILIASNTNNILTDLINKGEYDIRDRELILTNSPAMDILKSSNVERILFDKFGASRTREMMIDLEQDGVYRLGDDELASIREDFDAVYSSDSEGIGYMAEYAKKGYIMDPHTATCIKAYKELRDEKLPAIICSTAEWTKFSMSVAEALDIKTENDLDALKKISDHQELKIPVMVQNLFSKPVIHDIVIEKETIREEMLVFL
ncbi:MAG: threonine synthase [Sulfurovum sp.]|nr:threonine synthase [Sulfurovum sp.]